MICQKKIKKNLKHLKEAKYNPGMNNHDETDGESEDIQHHDIDNNKAIQNDTPNQKSMIKR